MHTGMVKSYDGRKGYGFIEPSDGSKEVYVHISALDRANLGGLTEGQKLRFDVEKDDLTGRMAAANLRLI